jgi:murein DD-endopeptidase MepM/ murein hydrolase activator NlpD
MKLFYAYKTRFNFLFFLVLVFLPVFFIKADTINELKNKISQKDADIEKLEAEIRMYQGQLNTLGEQKNSLSVAIKGLDITKKKLQTDISLTQKKIDKTNLTIESLSSDIGTKKDIIDNHIDAIEIDLRRTNEFENHNLLEILLSEKKFTSVWNDIDNIVSVREKIIKDIERLKHLKGELEDSRNVTISAKNDLLVLKSKLADQQKMVIDNANEKNKLLKETKNNEAAYQKLLKDRIAKRDAFEKELRDYEEQLQYILDPSKLPSGGVLSWPLEKIFVTQLFGKTVDSKRLYASGTHNGVDFRAAVGTPVMAMADGKIMGIGDTDLTCRGASFGKFVFIEYDNGLSSTFGHLSFIKVKEGEKIRRGGVVGYSGNTGHSTGPHLHVSLYASEAVKMESRPSKACDGRIYRIPVAPLNAYLDAMYYLPPYKIN